MSDRRTVTINRSTSKQAFAFSKQARFPHTRSVTNVAHYDKPSMFGAKTGNNTGRGFSSSASRFQVRKSQGEPPIYSSDIDRTGNKFGQI